MIARLRAMAHDAWLTEVAQKGEELKFVMYEKAQIDTTKIDSLLKFYKGKLKFTIDKNPYFTYVRPRRGGKEPDDILMLVKELLAALLTLSEV